MKKLITFTLDNGCGSVTFIKKTSAIKNLGGADSLTINHHLGGDVFSQFRVISDADYDSCFPNPSWDKINTK